MIDFPFEKYTQHPINALFPPLLGAEREALKASIQLYGQRHVIVENASHQILDGWTRFRLCKELEMVPKIECSILRPGEDELQYVIQANFLRRHLKPSQRFGMALALVSHLEAVKAPYPVESALQSMGYSSASVSKLKSLRDRAPDLYVRVLDEEVGLEGAYEQLLGRERPSTEVSYEKGGQEQSEYDQSGRDRSSSQAGFAGSKDKGQPMERSSGYDGDLDELKKLKRSWAGRATEMRKVAFLLASALKRDVRPDKSKTSQIIKDLVEARALIDQILGGLQ